MESNRAQPFLSCVQSAFAQLPRGRVAESQVAHLALLHGSGEGLQDLVHRISLQGPVVELEEIDDVGLQCPQAQIDFLRHLGPVQRSGETALGGQDDLLPGALAPAATRRSSASDSRLL